MDGGGVALERAQRARWPPERRATDPRSGDRLGRGASHNHPSGGPAGSDGRPAELAGVRRSQGPAAHRRVAGGVIRRRRASLATSSAGGSTLSGRTHRAPFRIRCARRVLRSGGSGRSRGSPSARPESAALATAANALTALAHERPLLRTRGPASDGTVLLCRSGSRSPPAVASLHRQAPTLLRRCGAGLAHNFNTGADVGDRGRRSANVGLASRTVDVQIGRRRVPLVSRTVGVRTSP